MRDVVWLFLKNLLVVCAFAAGCLVLGGYLVSGDFSQSAKVITELPSAPLRLQIAVVVVLVAAAALHTRLKMSQKKLESTKL